MSTLRVLPSPNLTPPAAFFAPKYALTPATVQVPGPAVAPLSGVVMPSVRVVSVMPGLDPPPPQPLAPLPERPPAPPPETTAPAAGPAAAAGEHQRQRGRAGDDAERRPRSRVSPHA